jgi:uncharacterized RDD family membrane protein YckC
MVAGYRLIRELGHGGMGSVWEAEEPATGRRVAVKVLSSRIAHSSETVDRFLREGRLAASLSHPRSTFVYSAGFDEGRPYIVMELMPGRNLKDLSESEGPMPVPRAVDFMLDVIEGLEAAHSLGVIHRDVKPSNCFLDSDGRVKVGDFGLSKSLVSDASLTGTGTFLGTPQFAAPEQVRGAEVDLRTDVYAVGSTLYQLIAGRPPFQGDAAAVIAQIVSDTPPLLSDARPDVPLELARIVARALDKDRERRYASLAQLREALLPFATGGTSMADLGRRTGAYMLDAFLVQFFVSLAGTLAGGFIGASGRTDLLSGPRNYILYGTIGLIGFALSVLYFAWCEGRFGRGIGKWLFGLRVVNKGGQPPGFLRGLLRAVFIPGALGVPVLSQLYGAWSMSESQDIPTMNLSMMAMGLLVSLAEALPKLACLLTMRVSNGYRGLHEFASGTRVVRIRRTEPLRSAWRLPVTAPLAHDWSGVEFGPYRPAGQIADRNGWPVIVARDDVLKRSAWVFLTPESAPPIPAPRLALSRPARQRWLQSGIASEQAVGAPPNSPAADGDRPHNEPMGFAQPADRTVRWIAFESVQGVPLSAIARPGTGLPWEQGRMILQGLAGELSASLTDGTLPEQLEFEQLWVHRGGRVKLLDAPVSAAGPPNEVAPPIERPSPDQASPQPARRAAIFFRTVADRLMEGQILPGGADRWRRDLQIRSDDDSLVRWSAEQLAELSSRPATLRWDDRLGALFVTMGIEYTLYWFVCFGLGILMWMYSDLGLLGKAAPSTVLALVLPAALAAWTRGGPAFLWLGIEVRSGDGRPVGRWRAACRSLIAWSPVLIMAGFVPGFVLFGQFQQMSPDGPPPAEILALVLTSCGGVVLSILALAGAVYSVIRPQRGLQDELAGTCLVPQ